MFFHQKQYSCWKIVLFCFTALICICNPSKAQEWEVGDTTSFWAFDFHFFRRYFKTEVTLQAIGQHCYVWTQNDSWNTGRINQNDVETILLAFEEKTPAADPAVAGVLSDTSGIYDELTGIYGEPPDVDDDPRIYILIIDCSEDIGYTPMLGYFDPVNQLTPIVNPHSNQHEMVYIDCDPFDPSSHTGVGSLVQQFSHLLQYGNDPYEKCWITEGITYLNQFLCGYGVANEEQKYSRNFLELYLQSSMSNCREQPEVHDRIKTAMFMQYLFEQYGIDVIQTLATDTDNNGREAVTAALAMNGNSDVDFDSVFVDEQLAWFLDSPQEWFYGGKFVYTYYESGSMLDAKTYTAWGTIDHPPYEYPGNQWSTDFITVVPPAPDLGDTLYFFGDSHHNFRVIAIKANLEWQQPFDAEHFVGMEFLTLDDRNRTCIDVSGYWEEYTIVYLAVMHKNARDGSQTSQTRFIVHNQPDIFPPPLNLVAQDHVIEKVPLVWSPPLYTPRKYAEELPPTFMDDTGANTAKRVKETFYRNRCERKSRQLSPSNLIEYNVYRSDVSGGPYQHIASTLTTEYSDTNVVCDQTYFYVVTALYDDPPGESEYSNEAAGTPWPTLPEPSTLITCISDHGVYGNADFIYPNFEWPVGTENHYNWEGRFWAGATVLGEDRVSHADYGNYEFYPPTGVGTESYEYLMGLRHFDQRLEFTDTFPLIGHLPLDIMILQRARMWPQSYPEYDDFLALEISVINQSMLDYEDFFIAWSFDADACALDYTDPHIDDLVDYDGWDGPDSRTDEIPDIYPGDHYDRGDIVDPFDWDMDGNTGYDEWGVPYGDPDNPGYDESLIEPDGFPDEYTLLIDEIRGQRIAFKHPELTDSIIVTGFAVPRNMSYIYDADNPVTPDQDFQQRDQTPYPCNGYIGGRLIYTPARLPVNGSCSYNYSGRGYALSDSLMMPLCHSWWNWEGDPGSDQEKLEYMDGSHLAMRGKMYMVNPHHPDYNAPVFDYRWLQSTGPFDFDAGDTLKLVYVVGVGHGLQGLRENMDNALQAYYYGSINSDPYRPSDFDSDVHWGFMATDVEDDASSDGLVHDYKLFQNYPNPFNTTTVFRYEIPDGRFSLHTTLKIYNILGQEVYTLVEKIQDPGYYIITWNGLDSLEQQVASGVYFYSLNAGEFTTTKRMVILR